MFTPSFDSFVYNRVWNPFTIMPAFIIIENVALYFC
jgi:hypothetical protein